MSNFILRSLAILTITLTLSSEGCNPSWFDCGNGKCILDMWICDGDNDCGNFKDEENCERPVAENECSSSQFMCATDKHCIPERWHCDGEKDCEDGSDEVRCDNVTEKCTGFTCCDHHCIPANWHCDGNRDCLDGSDEKSCPQDKLCTDSEFLCASGSCVNQSLVCDKHKDCVDGSDEGLHCGDPCENATCSQNCRATPEGPQCYCNGGYILESKDNKTCTDIDECQQEGFCSHECTNTVGSYKCSCKSGYELVNRTCKAEGADTLLVFTTVREIRAMYLHAQKYFLVRRASEKASAVDVDPKNKQIYWLEISNRSSVYSSNIEGSDYKTVLSHGLIVPEDIAVDYIANNLYITDSRLKQVLACKTDGSMCTVLHDQNVGKPRSIALDHTEGFLYWSDWGEQTAGIYRSGMDGSHKIPLVTTDIAWPNGIAIDHSTKRLYWADAKLKRVEYISLNGNSRKVIYNETVFHPYAVTVFEDTIYWSDWSGFSLESCNKFTGHDVRLIARKNGVHIMGVHVYHPLLTATVPNPCWSSECSHMCLISPVSGFQCACSYGYKLGKDGKTCTIEERSESIFVSEGSRIYYIIPKAVGSGVITEMPLQIRTTISRVSYDNNLHCLFVADVDTPAIYVINMSSLHMRVLVKSNLITPQDLAFDSRSNNLYWVDEGKGTVEVISIDSLKRVVLIKNLNRPVALAVSPEKGVMFVAMIGIHPSVMKCGMDGKNCIDLRSIRDMAVSLALHPSKTILYWADSRSGTISYTDYENSRFPRILERKAYDAMSVAASEEYIYWTSMRRELNLRKDNVTHVLPLPGQEKGAHFRRVTYSPATISAEKSECLIGNGGCSYLCLTSQRGRTCACPPDLMLDHDNASCVARRCEENDFKCVNGQCVPPSLRCDGKKDCDDGSDEVNCALSSACTKDQLACLNGECVPVLWRCDGERDCSDGSDEQNCNLTRCDSTQYRCESGKCISISWVCDGTSDCPDNSDEKICISGKACTTYEFKCESDGLCVNSSLRCDGRADCKDGSDENNCPNSYSNCKDMYRCTDGTCIYNYKVCDGHRDCESGEDENNCTRVVCEEKEILCPSSKRCIHKNRICDGDLDCADGSDEENCNQQSATLKPEIISPITVETRSESVLVSEGSRIYEIIQKSVGSKAVTEMQAGNGYDGFAIGQGVDYERPRGNPVYMDYFPIRILKPKKMA